MFYPYYIPDGASSKPSPNYKLSQLIKPTNIPKRKTRNKTSILPTNQNYAPSPSILNKQNYNKTLNISIKLTKNPKLKGNHTLNINIHKLSTF